jgi:hypothetical protein
MLNFKLSQPPKWVLAQQMRKDFTEFSAPNMCEDLQRLLTYKTFLRADAEKLKTSDIAEDGWYDYFTAAMSRVEKDPAIENKEALVKHLDYRREDMCMSYCWDGDYSEGLENAEDSFIEYVTDWAEYSALNLTKGETL